MFVLGGFFGFVLLTNMVEASEVCPDGGDWSKDESGPDFSYTAPSGYKISKVCVKGSTELQYFTADGDNGCWKVSGIGGNSCSAVKISDGSSCHDISHVSFLREQVTESTPSPRPTPTVTPTAALTATPVPTEDPGDNEETATPTPTPTLTPTPTPTETTVPVGGGESSSTSTDSSSETGSSQTSTIEKTNHVPGELAGTFSMPISPQAAVSLIYTLVSGALFTVGYKKWND